MTYPLEKLYIDDGEAYICFRDRKGKIFTISFSVAGAREISLGHLVSALPPHLDTEHNRKVLEDQLLAARLAIAADS